MSRILTNIFVVVFVINQAFGLLMNHMRLAHINASIGDDVELICTGNEMRWISVSLTMQENEFVFVESPTETQQIQADELCPSIDARDDESPDLMAGTDWISYWSSYVSVKLAVLWLALCKHKFALSIPRAPPR